MKYVSQGRIILKNRDNFEFENEGVFNPACIKKDGITHIFYRATQKGNFSSIGYCQLKDNKIINQDNKPIIFPEYRYESHGIEDPRITYIDNKYYLFYTAYDGINAVVAYATSTDLKTFNKKGLVTPQASYDKAEDIFRDSGVSKKYTFFERIFKKNHNNIYLWEKDAVLFPKKINGKYALLHRILPGIQILYFDDFDQITQAFWQDYLKNLNDYVVLDPRYPFENSHIGAGCVPIETSKGWILIYHTVENTKTGKIYHASAALLDKNNPQKVIGRLDHPLFSPESDWEKDGVVNNVVFPTSAIVEDDLIYIYYGAADNKIGLRTVDLSQLLKELSS
jgi:predicted GH43/DUF377 family glycosyl hydrolase